MANVLVREEYLESIADAIRYKNSGSDTYTPSQMSQAITDIQNSYSASDEGKVVSNGSLASQTALSISDNGTYDTTTKNEVIVNVNVGLPSADGVSF